MSFAPAADAPPRAIAAYLLSVLRELGLDGVLVGTTAALATRDIDVRSKDADVVAVGARSTASLKKALRETARRDGLEFVEQEWGASARLLGLPPTAFTE